MGPITGLATIATALTVILVVSALAVVGLGLAVVAPGGARLPPRPHPASPDDPGVVPAPGHRALTGSAAGPPGAPADRQGCWRPAGRAPGRR